MYEERVPEHWYRNHGGRLGKPCTQPMEKGNHFRHQHLGFGLPALLLVRLLEAGSNIYGIV